jgi:hypothetical protein
MSLIAKYFVYNVPAPLGLIWSNEKLVKKVEEIEEVDIIEVSVNFCIVHLQDLLRIALQ